MIDEASALEELERRRMYGKTPARQPLKIRGKIVGPWNHKPRATHTTTPAPAPDKKKTPFDDLVYATGRWEIYRQDAGMGEKDYCVLRNGYFFCRTEQEQVAKDICAAYDKSRPHTPAPDESNVIKNLKAICEAQNEKIIALTEIRILYEQLERMQPAHDAQVAKAAREQVLDKIHGMCECIPSKDNDRDFDKGFHQAMTLVRGWCKSLRAQQGGVSE